MENENEESLEEIHQRIVINHGHYSRNEDRPDTWKSQDMIDEEIESCEECWNEYRKIVRVDKRYSHHYEEDTCETPKIVI